MSAGLTDGLLEQYVAILQTHRASDNEIANRLVALDPMWLTLIGKWNSTPLKSLSLSSVGIAIAHSNWHRIHPDADLPLSIWIEE